MSSKWSAPRLVANDNSPLVKAIAQYPILECLVSHLRPDDLITLTTISQNVHAQIRMHEPKVKISLLKKTLCPGIGAHARVMLHCPCRTKSKNWHAMAGCAGAGFRTESQPCAVCNINTCDECRFHVLYQPFVESPGLDDRRWWAGFVGTSPSPVAIYPPKGISSPNNWRRPVGKMEPQHDLGRVHAELTAPELADPEPMEHILDWNLGHGFIKPSGRTTAPYTGLDIVFPFNCLSRDRIRLTCGPCHDEHKIKTSRKICSCTLRNRFVDRWICLPCYLKEFADDRNCDAEKSVDEDDVILSRKCPCGTSFGRHDKQGRICNWCDGIVLNEKPRDDVSGATDTLEDEEEDVNSEDDADVPNSEVEIEMQHNKNGSLAMVVDGKRISREKVGRAIVEQWSLAHGADLGCTCCHCPGRGRPPHSEDGNGEGMPDSNWEDEEEGAN